MTNQTESDVDPALTSLHRLDKDLKILLINVKRSIRVHLTMDEQLMPLKSRCSFVTFMPNKPDKYGVKFWVLTNVETKYVSNIDVYLGAQEKELRFGAPLALSVVVNLCKHIKRKGYNITCDNFFTLLPVAEKLTRDKLSIVETMRKNRR